MHRYNIYQEGWRLPVYMTSDKNAYTQSHTRRDCQWEFLFVRPPWLTIERTRLPIQDTSTFPERWRTVASRSFSRSRAQFLLPSSSSTTLPASANVSRLRIHWYIASHSSPRFRTASHFSATKTRKINAISQHDDRDVCDIQISPKCTMQIYSPENLLLN